MADLWTAEQHAAIGESGHLLLAANAGTGKTSTVVGKILWKLGLDVGEAEDGVVAPCSEPCDLSQIAAITFTEKAAGDLRKKLSEALSDRGIGPGEIDRAFVGTIHSFCGEILRQHALRLDIDPSFRVMDAREVSLRLGDLVREVVLEALEAEEPDVIELLKDAPLDPYGPFGPSVTEFVRRAIDHLRWHHDRFADWFAEEGSSLDDSPELDPELLASLTGPDSGIEEDSDEDPEPESEMRHLSHAVAVYRLGYRVLGRWLHLLEQENRRDFDSLILDVRRLLSHERFAPALNALRAKYRLLIVDEFQDTDRAQRDIALSIGGLEGHEPGDQTCPQLFLVGDPKQSIYGFRNADVRVWNEVERRLRSEGSVLRLGRNFRSDPAIVTLINETCAPAFEAAAESLKTVDPEAVVPYDPLDPGVEPRSGAGVEWLAPPDELSKADRDAYGAALLAGRIAAILDPDSKVRVGGAGRGRPVEPADVAVLAARADTLGIVESALRERGVPTFNSSSRGLAQRPEVMDAITALRLAENPVDDLRMFAWLRSPFVGLRDEVIARIRIDPDISGRSLLEKSRAWLEAVEAGSIEEFEAPEHPQITIVERYALRRGLAALAEVRGLVGRAEPSEILETLLDRTSYRLHLRLRSGGREALANLERLRLILAGFRFLSLADFLAAWDRAALDRRSDIGTATLPPGSEGAVFLSTVHGAKGLEWPIVAMAGAEDGLRRNAPSRWEGWLDRELGPVLLPPSGDRGARTRRATERRLVVERSESMRLLYVALTRARERLIIASRISDPEGHAAWLASALLERAEMTGGPSEAESIPAAGNHTTKVPVAEDPGTGTGRQLDAFGLNEEPSDELGQLNLLSASNHAPSSANSPLEQGVRLPVPVSVYRQPDPIQAEFAQAPIGLDGISLPTARERNDGRRKQILPTAARLRSVTELKLRNRDPEAWRLKYVHGVSHPGTLGPVAGGRRQGSEDSAEALSGSARGSLVHEILERVEDDLDTLFDEVIQGLGEEEIGYGDSERRRALRENLRHEIERVLSSEEWRNWVADEHHREMPFVHFIQQDEWLQGRIDLFVPPRAGTRTETRAPLIVDFKTDRIHADAIPERVDSHRLQAQAYRDAVDEILRARAPGSGPVQPSRVVLYFTHTGQQEEL